MSFLFVWQTCLQAPLVIASGAIGFTHYFGYLVPLGYWSSKAVAGAVVVLIVALLYRNIRTIGKISGVPMVGGDHHHSVDHRERVYASPGEL